MKRREFITLVGGTAGLWPLAAHAQQRATPVVGFLHVRSPDDTVLQASAFRRGLAEIGYVESQNVTIEYRWARGQYDRLPAMATELARRPVTVIFAGADPAAVAAKAATSTISIVFSVGSDPVMMGLVASYNRPGGNATGINILTSTLEAKRLGLLRELVPQAAMVGLLLNPNDTYAQSQLREVQEAARAIGLQVQIFRTATDREIEAAFKTIEQQRVAALAVAAGPFTERDKLVALAARYAVPAMYHFREHAVAGGLISYGVDLPDVYRQLGVYTGRILKGDKPADLPVLQPTKFELVINLKTAQTLGLTIPPGVLAIADEVIE